MHLNLASPSTKNALRYDTLSQRAMFLGFLTLTVLAWFILLLGSIAVFTEVKSRQLRRQAQSAAARATMHKVEFFNQELRRAKKNLEQFHRIQSDRPRLAKTARNLLTLLPGGIVLEDLAIDGIQQKITIAGVASNRSALLKLGEQLAKNPGYLNVTLPLEQLLQETDIPFSISFGVNPAAMRP